MTLSSRLRFLWLTLAVVLLDRATKAWIESRPADHFPHPVIRDFFNLVDSRNPGIAFSFLAGLSSPALRVILICGSLIIIAVITWLLVASRGIRAANAAAPSPISSRSIFTSFPGKPSIRGPPSTSPIPP